MDLRTLARTRAVCSPPHPPLPRWGEGDRRQRCVKNWPASSGQGAQPSRSRRCRVIMLPLVVTPRTLSRAASRVHAASSQFRPAVIRLVSKVRQSLGSPFQRARVLFALIDKPAVKRLAFNLKTSRVNAAPRLVDHAMFPRSNLRCQNFTSRRSECRRKAS